MNTVVKQRLAGEGGAPFEGEQEGGKARPSEPGRGRVSPPANPDGVTA